MTTPARVRCYAEAQAHGHAMAQAQSAGEARVLVLVPTSSTRPSSPSEKVAPHVSGSNARADAILLADAIGAFPLDKAGRRLSSLRCAVGFAARAHAVSEKGRRSDVAWMVTTTYAGDKDAWRPDHWKTAIHRARQWAIRQGFAFRYVWVAELQKRGVIHYHLVCWLPSGVRMPKWDVRGWWPHGRCNRARVRSSAVGYLMKYLSKGNDVSTGSFPRGARIYGVGGLDHSLRRARRWLRLPRFVQGVSDIHDKWTRRVGGGWLAPGGEHFVSEFRTTLVGGVRCLLRVARHAVSIDASGPFSWLRRPLNLAI